MAIGSSADNPRATVVSPMSSPAVESSSKRRAALRGLACASVLLAAPASANALPWTVQVRDSAGHPLADAVVAVELNGKPALAAPQTSAQMAQRQRQFQPYVLVVQTGTAVSFPNFDTVRHHVYSFSDTKKFDIKLYAGTPARPEVFDRPGVATLGCNIHDRMSAHIVVVDTPIFSKSDASGLVTLDLPPGEHVMRFWHPRLGVAALKSQAVSVGKSGGHTDLTLTLVD
jgi:plastocyanin